MDTKFVLLLVANIVFIVLLRMSRNRKRLNSFLTVVFMILVTLTVIESAYRLFFRGETGPTESGNFGSSFNTPVALTGFTVKNIPDLQVTKKAANGALIYDAHYSIIPDSGFNSLPINHRAGYHVSDAARDSVEFVFLGCSFTFGTGVPDTASMAYRVGAAFDYNSLNYGGSGFGTHQVYQIYKNKYSTVPDKKKRVFIYTFIPDHLLRAKGIYSWCLNDPYFEVENDSLKLLGPAYKHSSSARGQGLVRLFSLNRTLTIISDLGNAAVQRKGAAGVTDADYKRVELMLADMNRSIQARGDKFLVLHWDDYKGLKTPEGGYFVDGPRINKMGEELRKQGAITASASAFFNFSNIGNTIPQDNHPSIQGNLLMANYLIEKLQTSGIK